MALVSLRDVGIAFGGPPVLDGVDLQIERGQRVCLVGRNGEGKSTLMRLIDGDLEPQRGEVIVQEDVRIARLAQQVPLGLRGAVFDVVAGGLGRWSELLADYHRVSGQLTAEDVGGSGQKALLGKLDRIQHALETDGGWQIHQRVETVISRMKLDGHADVDVGALSAGLKRRVLLARALVSAPDVLLLDEPTNHLDIDAIRWLEEFLLRQEATLLFVTHDRVFLQKLATRIVEIDRGRLTSWACDYATYLQRKADLLAAEAGRRAGFDKKLSQAEAWIRRGIQGRRTRNEGRVGALLKMRDERRTRREVPGSANLQVHQAEASGRIVLRARHVGFRYDDRPLIDDFSTTILRGDKVGLIGPNGAGKTTLLRLLLGELSPRRGTVRLGARLEVVYFDQLHAQLDEDRTVLDNLAGGQHVIDIGGKRRHVIGYLRGFLFPPSRSRSRVSELSGGERNRLLLARLFARPSNVIVLDEPTNDLDCETLELLEERLLEYPGTLLLVSHDRAFLNNVVTSTLAFEGGGCVKEYVGGYDDWLRQRKTSAAPARPGPAAKSAKPRPKPAGPRRLTYKEKLEIEALPQRIEDLETRQGQLHEAMADPAFYKQRGDEIAKVAAELKAVEQELAETYRRWETLDELQD